VYLALDDGSTAPVQLRPRPARAGRAAGQHGSGLAFHDSPCLHCDILGHVQCACGRLRNSETGRDLRLGGGWCESLSNLNAPGVHEPGLHEPGLPGGPRRINQNFDIEGLEPSISVYDLTFDIEDSSISIYELYQIMVYGVNLGRVSLTGG
jgi:hypothetical protein